MQSEEICGLLRKIVINQAKINKKLKMQIARQRIVNKKREAHFKKIIEDIHIKFYKLSLNQMPNSYSLEMAENKEEYLSQFNNTLFIAESRIYDINIMKIMIKNNIHILNISGYVYKSSDVNIGVCAMGPYEYFMEFSRDVDNELKKYTLKYGKVSMYTIDLSKETKEIINLFVESSYIPPNKEALDKIYEKLISNKKLEEEFIQMIMDRLHEKLYGCDIKIALK
jgi:hypothetical protein